MVVRARCWLGTDAAEGEITIVSSEEQGLLIYRDGLLVFLKKAHDIHDSGDFGSVVFRASDL